MTNIWEFLLQTLSVSLTAALLLIIKQLLADKLSPRWQYSVWGILALRILLPVSIRRYIFLPLPLWLETWKANAEAALNSAKVGFASSYTAIYTPLSPRHVLPEFSGEPKSLTDWLLVIYAAGLVLCLLWYLCSYLRLRLLLRHGTPASPKLQEKLHAVCKQYNLKACRTIEVAGLPSAFVCGFFRPVLAVPAGTDIDNKILLHELLHLRYHDALQNILWYILRALHWCNPFLQYCFNRIGNDMEALCDQRVLERLKGEERREYGVILLNMANDRCSRAPGSSSISNGGRNISRRIAAIVRFKQYPRGMTLVSVCILIVLLCPALFGSAHAYSASYYRPVQAAELTQAMALARINRCTTVASALDTYAKGLMFENGIYIASASSLSKHETLALEMHHNAAADDWVAYHFGFRARP